MMKMYLFALVCSSPDIEKHCKCVADKNTHIRTQAKQRGVPPGIDASWPRLSIIVIHTKGDNEFLY
jgi:hypothetical protein